jgi:cytidine deaminase
MESHDMTVDEQQLIDAAKKVRPNAHAPYSAYKVGAALIDDTGTLHTGCNVENAAFPEGTCAEANVIGSMVAAGGKRIVAIAAVGGADDIDLIGEGKQIDSYSIEELLPAGFRLR